MVPPDEPPDDPELPPVPVVNSPAMPSETWYLQKNVSVPEHRALTLHPHVGAQSKPMFVPMM